MATGQSRTRRTEPIKDSPKSVESKDMDFSIFAPYEVVFASGDEDGVPYASARLPFGETVIRRERYDLLNEEREPNGAYGERPSQTQPGQLIVRYGNDCDDVVRRDAFRRMVRQYGMPSEESGHLQPQDGEPTKIESPNEQGEQEIVTVTGSVTVGDAATDEPVS